MIINFLFLLILFYLINEFFIKKNILPSFTGDIHQKYASVTSKQLTGGIFFVFSFLFYNIDNLKVYYLFFLGIFIIGFLSDINKLKSVTARFFLQVIIIFLFVLLYDLQVYSTRLEFLDDILKYQFINYLFVSFCILIVINGSNFIDGLNTLLIGYYTIIILIIFKLIKVNNLYLDVELFSLFYLLFIIFILNLFNKLYSGDSGSYLLGFFFSFILISLHNFNQNISPYFIVLLLWYPGFENLFSIIRKYKSKKSPLSPDEKHLHQLIFFFIKKSFNLKEYSANLTTANLINLFNGAVFLLGSFFLGSTNVQIGIILFNVILYCLIYMLLIKYKSKIN